MQALSYKVTYIYINPSIRQCVYVCLTKYLKNTKRKNQSYINLSKLKQRAVLIFKIIILY